MIPPLENFYGKKILTFVPKIENVETKRPNSHKLSFLNYVFLY
jgi:hypothetical protein